MTLNFESQISNENVAVARSLVPGYLFIIFVQT
jgi:hypothetical protein